MQLIVRCIWREVHADSCSSDCIVSIAAFSVSAKWRTWQPLEKYDDAARVIVVSEKLQHDHGELFALKYFNLLALELDI